MSTRRIGGIFQLGFVVDDLDLAIEHWATRLKVGPFVVSRHAAYSVFSYRGVEGPPDVSLAFAFSGDTNIELIQQHDATPSVFLDFLLAHGPGLQHVGVLSDDIEADTGMLQAEGASMITRLVNAGNGVETRFFDTDLHPGAMLELIQRSAGVDEGFAALRAMADGWDGKTAIIG